MNLPDQKRNTYVDFLRALGLLLLIGVHVDAPGWYKPLRSFDVPLMVFISALCYHPHRTGGYLRYCIKRFKRIYTPVFIFLTLFFILDIIGNSLTIFQLFSYSQILGSYLLLNGPSIGYVWIMRVFLLMALIIPGVEHYTRKSNFITVLFGIALLLLLQYALIQAIEEIPVKMIQYVCNEIILYGIGYLPLAVLGLSIRKFSRRELSLFIILCGVAIICYVASNNWVFNPNKFKYPPSTLYLIYGLFASSLLWSIKNWLEPYTSIKITRYLSTNSMWIYLWHIIPVYIIARFDWIENTWFLRYIMVVITAIALNNIYFRITKIFPDNIRKGLV